MASAGGGQKSFFQTTIGPTKKKTFIGRIVHKIDNETYLFRVGTSLAPHHPNDQGYQEVFTCFPIMPNCVMTDLEKFPGYTKQGGSPAGKELEKYPQECALEAAVFVKTLLKLRKDGISDSIIKIVMCVSKQTGQATSMFYEKIPCDIYIKRSMIFDINLAKDLIKKGLGRPASVKHDIFHREKYNNELQKLYQTAIKRGIGPVSKQDQNKEETAFRKSIWDGIRMAFGIAIMAILLLLASDFPMVSYSIPFMLLWAIWKMISPIYYKIKGVSYE